MTQAFLFRMQASMKLALRLRDPSPDWLAMRKVIEASPSLRSDVVLEVSEEQCRFLDATGCEIMADAPEVAFPRAVADLEAKLRLLTLLHEKFSAAG